MLLRVVEQRNGILRSFAACFRDYRNPELIEHTVTGLVRQRAYGLVSGYEDLADLDQSPQEPLLALLCGKEIARGNVGGGGRTAVRRARPGETQKPMSRD